MNNNNIWGHGYPDPYLKWGNGFLSEENKSVSASSSMAYHSNIPTPNVDFSSSSNSYLANYGIPDVGVSSDPRVHYAKRRSSLISETDLQSVPYHNQLDIRGSTSTGNSEADFGRLYFKRKSSAYPIADDMMNSTEYYNVTNSSGLPISSYQYISNPNSGTHSWLHRPTCMLSGYPRNYPSSIGERFAESHRNVRTRHGHPLQLQNNSVGYHISRSLPHNFHQTTSTSSQSTLPINSCWRFQSPRFFRHPIGSRGANTETENADWYSSNLVTCTNSVPTIPIFPGLSTQDDYNYVHSVNPCTSSRYATMDDASQFENEVLRHWRHYRLGQNGERRMRSLSDGHVYTRLNDEDEMLIDSSTFYDPPVMFDEHRNMRMDIDNMTYEELIALEEQIGSVSTGLSEVNISKCLTRTIYGSDQNQCPDDERSCVICLEEYKAGQSVGKLNCRHDFHASCIKKWLFIKNACPVCKSAALRDKGKGKQVLFS